MRDIVDVAMASGMSKLVEAVKAAGLVDTRKSPGPFTGLAPTDEAFNKIPQADWDTLMKDTAKLKDVLTLHVVEGKLGFRSSFRFFFLCGKVFHWFAATCILCCLATTWFFHENY